MPSRLLGSFKVLWSLEKYERTKLLFISSVFMLVITAYTVCKELKDIVFVATVGSDYVPQAKMLSLFLLIPAILFYSYLVNKIRRYQLLCFYSILYGLVGLIFVYFIGHPEIGVGNTNTGPGRLLGWLFYVFIEGYSPFIISVAWAFANSVFSPKEAKEGYGFLVAGSKLGGVLSAGAAWYLLSHVTVLSGVTKQQLLLFLPSLILMLVPVVILLFMRTVSGQYLHGYQAAYEYQKSVDKGGEPGPGIFTGLWMIIRQPYVLGIFGMIFLFEVMNAVLSYLRIVYSIDGAGIETFGSRLFAIAFGYHTIGLIFALFGTTALLRLLGERRCLFLIPFLFGAILSVFLIFRNFASFMFTFIGIRAANYGFFYPVRESLYIPTVKSVKFQSKAWIDAFGTKMAKGTGSGFNYVARIVLRSGGLSLFNAIHVAFFGLILGLWAVVAWMVGKRYVAAIENNEVIGAASVQAEAQS